MNFDRITFEPSRITIVPQSDGDYYDVERYYEVWYYTNEGVFLPIGELGVDWGYDFSFFCSFSFMLRYEDVIVEALRESFDMQYGKCLHTCEHFGYMD